MKDSLFGLDRAGTEDGMRLLVTVNDNAELSIVGSILEDEQIPYLSKDRGSGGAVRLIAGYSIFGTDILVPEERYADAMAVLDAYRNGTPVEEDGADGARTEPDADTDGED